MLTSANSRGRCSFRCRRMVAGRLLEPAASGENILLQNGGKTFDIISLRPDLLPRERRRAQEDDRRPCEGMRPRGNALVS